jgi:hypothetical protein
MNPAARWMACGAVPEGAGGGQREDGEHGDRDPLAGDAVEQALEARASRWTPG